MFCKPSAPINPAWGTPCNPTASYAFLGAGNLFPSHNMAVLQSSYNDLMNTTDINADSMEVANNVTVGGNFSVAGLANFMAQTPYSLAYFDVSDNLQSLLLQSYQIPLGATGTIPSAATLTGTANRVNITFTPGAITFTTPQDIATTSSPTFAGATLTGITANSLLCTSAANILEATTFATTTGMTVALVNGVLTINTPQSLQTSASPTFVAATLSGLTASTALYSNASKQLTSLALTNGQLMVGSTGAIPVAASLLERQIKLQWQMQLAQLLWQLHRIFILRQHQHLQGQLFLE